jgi:hypothetical protein
MAKDDIHESEVNGLDERGVTAKQLLSSYLIGRSTNLLLCKL